MDTKFKVGDNVKTRIGMNWRVLIVHAVSWLNDFKVYTLKDDTDCIVGDFFEEQCKPCT